MLDIVITSPRKIIFKGQAESIIFPGDNGVFEVLPFHKRLLSRLLSGQINVDGQLFPISRGVVKVERNKVTAVVEAAGAEDTP
jgi:F-type H+-transporting ATPase subunit epsilon